MPITEGTPAPDWTLQDQEGSDVSLADFRGKDLILYFYPRDETPGCTKEACAFRDLWDEIRAVGAEVVGVSPDGGDAHQKFIGNHKLPFTLLSDPDRKVMAEYGAWGEKMMYGKLKIGVNRSTTWIGPDGVVKKHWKRVGKAADHPARVLTLLTAE